MSRVSPKTKKGAHSRRSGPILPKVAAEMVEKGPISQDWPSGNDESRVLKRQENTISVVVPRFPFQKRIL